MKNAAQRRGPDELVKFNPRQKLTEEVCCACESKDQA